MDELYEMIMTKEDRDIEEIARAISQRRNELRLEANKDDPAGLVRVKEKGLPRETTKPNDSGSNCEESTRWNEIT